jgi:AhpD family alkylhydroperoxidase
MKVQSPETMELAAISAAVAGKCQPCFAYHFKQAQVLGIPDEQIQEIIQLAKDIRASGDKHMDEFASRNFTGISEATT